MKRLISAILVVCLCFTLCSCRKANEDLSTNEGDATGGVIAKEQISLLCDYSDSFNPYTAHTEANRKITLLMFDTLTKTDNSFETVYCLAKEIDFQDNVYTVKIKDARFTDGSAVTAQDVVYSYQLAKESETEYASRFYGVKSVDAANLKTVIFTLNNHDPYFANLLDFPVLKSETAGKFDSDGVEIAPIGCGRYVLSKDRKSLSINLEYYGKKGSIGEIKLINSPDGDAAAHYVETGATELYYTSADDGEIVRMSGKKTEVNLNRFVYIGINTFYGSLSTNEMRYAISSALDRETICRTAYYNNATAATGYFNPAFKETAPVQTISQKPNLEITIENLAKIGYNDMNADGFYGNAAGNNSVFTLLVNEENASRVAAAELIAQQCAAAGIEIVVQKRSFEQYKQMIESNSFQLYLGEIEVLPNMDFSPLVMPGGSVAFGLANAVADEKEAQEDETLQNQQQPQSNTVADMIKRYRSGECSAQDLAGALLTEMVQIPVCYRKGILFYDSEITGGVEASISDIYFSIEDYTFN